MKLTITGISIEPNKIIANTSVIVLFILLLIITPPTFIYIYILFIIVYQTLYYFYIDITLNCLLIIDTKNKIIL